MSMLKDMKEGLRSARKADITHVRTGTMVYVSRACEYGSAKYERANYIRPTGDGAHTEPTAADFERYRGYLRAVISHVMAVLDAMERHQALDPHLKDVEGMKRAAYAADTDVTPGQAVGASLLPHLCGAGASYNMAIEQAIGCGLLPADPGRPWEAEAKPSQAVELLAAMGIMTPEEATVRLKPSPQLGDEGRAVPRKGVKMGGFDCAHPACLKPVEPGSMYCGDHKHYANDTSR